MPGANAATSIGPASQLARKPCRGALDRAEAGERRERGQSGREGIQAHRRPSPQAAIVVPSRRLAGGARADVDLEGAGLEARRQVEPDEREIVGCRG